MTIVEVNPVNFTEKLNEAYRSNNKQRQSRTIHASGFWNCRLQQYHSLTGTPATEEVGEPDWEVSAEVGNTIHNLVQKRLVQSGMAVMLPSFDDNPQVRHLERVAGQLQPAVEVPLSEATLPPEQVEFLKQHRFGGRIDAIVTTKDNGPAILEIKTISSRYFTPRSNDYISYYNDKLAHYELQLMAYMHLFRMPDGSQITTGFIYVVNQADPREVKMYKVSYNASLMEQEFERIKTVKICLDANTPPDPEPHRGPCMLGSKPGCKWFTLCPASLRSKKNKGYELL